MAKPKTFEVQMATAAGPKIEKRLKKAYKQPLGKKLEAQAKRDRAAQFDTKPARKERSAKLKAAELNA